MFRGITAINIDPKGRLAMPTRYREVLQDDCEGQLIITIDTEAQCLLIYPLPEWEVIERKIEALPSFNPAARRIQRLLMGHATEMQVDNSGRILIPPVLRDYAHIDKHVMLVGQGKKFELWSEALWEQQRAQWLADTNTLDLPDELRSLSL